MILLFQGLQAIREIGKKGLCCKILPTGRSNDLVCAGQIGKAAVLRADIDTVRSTRAGKGEMLQK